MLRRKFGQLLASGLALMGLGGIGAAAAKRRGGQLVIDFRDRSSFAHDVAFVTGQSEDVAEFYDLWQESMWPGCKSHPQYHAYRNDAKFISEGIERGELFFAIGRAPYEKAFKDAMEGYSGTFFTNENAAKYVLSL